MTRQALDDAASVLGARTYPEVKVARCPGKSMRCQCVRTDDQELNALLTKAFEEVEKVGVQTGFGTHGSPGRSTLPGISARV